MINGILFQRNLQTRAFRDAKETEDESLDNLIGSSFRNSAMSHMRPSTIQKLERNLIYNFRIDHKPLLNQKRNFELEVRKSQGRPTNFIHTLE